MSITALKARRRRLQALSQRCKDKAARPTMEDWVEYRDFLLRRSLAA